MEWINLHSSVLGAPAFLLSTESERGTWLCLLGYCCTQENGGRILGAKSWPAAAWPQICRVAAKSVARASGLWSWVGEDLVVHFYPAAKETEVQAKREAARSGGLRSGEARRKHGSASASTEDEANTKHSFDSASTEGKGREGKGKEGEEEEGAASASASSAPASSAPLSLSSEPASQPDRKSPKNPTPDECPEPLRSRMLRIGDLLHRRASTPWKAEELAELRSQRLDAISDEEFAADLEALEGYYGLALTAEEDFRRRELIRLLRHWPDDVRNALKRAQEWRAKHDPDGLGAAS